MMQNGSLRHIGHPPSWIFKDWILLETHSAWLCQLLWRSVMHLPFWIFKIEILTTMHPRDVRHYHAKFCGDWPYDTAIFSHVSNAIKNSLNGCTYYYTSVLWRCWLGSSKGIRPVKNWVVWCWRGCLSGVRCRLAYGPADATATHCLLLQ